MTRTAAIGLLALLTATPSWGQASVGQSSDRAETTTPVVQSSSEKVRENPGNQYILVKTVVGKVIGTIEVGGLVASELNLSGSFWSWLEHINMNFLGFVIVAMFIATWAIALTIWRLGRIEERWSAHLEDAGTAG